MYSTAIEQVCALHWVSRWHRCCPTVSILFSSSFLNKMGFWHFGNRLCCGSILFSPLGLWLPAYVVTQVSYSLLAQVRAEGSLERTEGPVSCLCVCVTLACEVFRRREKSKSIPLYPLPGFYDIWRFILLGVSVFSQRGHTCASSLWVVHKSVQLQMAGRTCISQHSSVLWEGEYPPYSPTGPSKKTWNDLILAKAKFILKPPQMSLKCFIFL